MKTAITLLLLALLGSAAGCGKSKSSSTTPPTNQGNFSLQPPNGSSIGTATVGAVYSQTFIVVSGGTPPYTFGPAGIPPGFTITYLPPNAFALSGTATAANGTGQGAFEFTVVDALGNMQVQDYLFTVLGQPSGLTLGPMTLPPMTRGVSFTQTLTVAGATLPVVWALQGQVPPGLSLGSSSVGNNQLFGIPSTSGTYSFSVVASDNSNPVKGGSTTYTVTVQ